MFDTLQAMNELVANGVEPKTAQAHINLFKQFELSHHENLVKTHELIATETKISSEIKDVRKDITSLDEKLTAKIDNVEEKLTAKISSEIKEVRKDIISLDEKLTAKIDNVEEKLTARIDNIDNTLSKILSNLRWAIGTVIAGIAVLISFFAFLHH